jgi:hypothetical protein
MLQTQTKVCAKRKEEISLWGKNLGPPIEV